MQLPHRNTRGIKLPPLTMFSSSSVSGMPACSMRLSLLVVSSTCFFRTMTNTTVMTSLFHLPTSFFYVLLMFDSIIIIGSSQGRTEKRRSTLERVERMFFHPSKIRVCTQNLSKSLWSATLAYFTPSLAFSVHISKTSPIVRRSRSLIEIPTSVPRSCNLF